MSYSCAIHGWQHAYPCVYCHNKTIQSNGAHHDVINQQPFQQGQSSGDRHSSPITECLLKNNTLDFLAQELRELKELVAVLVKEIMK